jgi:TonB-dependent starch-binding outer membrane protein SusC
MKKIVEQVCSFYYGHRKKLLMMRNAVLIILISAFQVFATGSYSQTAQLNLNLKNATIKEVLTEIENQSEFYFLYNSELIDVTRKVDISVKDEKVNNILSRLFSDDEVNVSISDRHIVLTPVTEMSVQQQKTISGKVTDSNNQPLPGVTLVVKGTTTGTVTNADGNYSIFNTPENAILVFSFVGMQTQEIVIGKQSIIDVTMIVDAIGIEEVVAIGYGTVRKRDLTGSVSSIKNNVISTQAISRIDQAFQGRVAGVQLTTTSSAPGSTATIRIRGGNSINSNNEPLYVIDGIIGVGDLTSINPNDVESVEVLRDASSTAIYGSRGANGVIIVTTKRGKESKGVQLNYSGYVGVQSVSHRIDMLNGLESAKYQNEVSSYSGTIPVYPDVTKVANTDWFEQSFKSVAMITDQNVSLTNADENGNYMLSLNYFNQDGLMYKNRLQRYQIRFNIDQNVGKNFLMGATLTSSYNQLENPMLGDISLIPSIPVYNEDGSYSSVNPVNGRTFNSPNAIRELNTDFTNKVRGLGNIYGQLTLFKALILKSTFGFDFDWQKRNIYQSTELPSRKLDKTGGRASVNTFFNNTIQNENTLSFGKTMGNHSFNLLGGFTAQKFVYEDLRTSVDGFQNDVTQYNAMQTGTPSTRTINTTESKWSLLSGLIRGNYNFNGRYLFTVSLRADGSSRLADGNKWAYFPSAAIAWRASEENFIKNLNLFSNLKIRASYGVTGNQSIEPYSVADKLFSGSTVMNGAEVIGFYPGSASNKDLKWEETAQYNVGMDVGFFKNKLSAEIDLYYKKTTDLLLNRELPFQTGFTSILENVGDTENKGIELTINSVNIDKSNFSWRTSFIFSMNRNKVLNLAGKDFLENGTGQRLIVGQPVGTFWGSKFLGTWKEGEIPEKYKNVFKPGEPRFEDLDDNGVINSLDFQIIGDSEPDFFGGISNDFTYKRFTLGLFFDYSVGNEIFDLATSISTGWNTNCYGIMRDAWTTENQESNIPRPGSISRYIPDTAGGPGNYAYTVGSSWFLHDGTYLRLKTLNIEYNLPVNKSGIFNQLSVYATGSNLFTLTNYFGYTPDVNFTGTHSTRRGFDANAYPLARIVSLGIKAQF